MSHSERFADRISKAESRVNSLRASRPAAIDALPHALDPVGFVRNVLKAESALNRVSGSPYQFDWLESISNSEQVVIRSAHGCGKTTAMAWAALWWLSTRPDGLVIALAPTQERQARGILAREVEHWARRGRVELRSDGIGLHHATTGARLVMLSGAADVGNVEGLHARSVLLICDEAKSLTRATLNGVSGALTGEEARVVMASTPGAPSGAFYDACSSPREEWSRFHIRADESSNVHPRWVEGRKRAWGESSSTFRMRVLGEFPEDGAGSLFPWSLLHAARHWPGDPSPSSRDHRLCSMGVDVARSVAGDASAVCVVRHGEIVARERWHEPDSMRTIERVLAHVLRHSPTRIRVDASGPGGGVVDRLRQMGRPVDAVFFGGRAIEATRFANWRAEAYHSLKRRLDDRSLRLPDDDRLAEELAAVRVLFDRSGRLQLIAKDEIRDVIGRSPDDADALALAIAEGDATDLEPPAQTLHIGYATFYTSAGWRARSDLPPTGDPLLWPESMKRR